MRRQRTLFGNVLLILALLGGLSLTLTGCDEKGRWEIKNEPPRLTAIGAKSVTEGQILSFQVTATDPDGDKLTLWVENPPSNSTFIDDGQGTGTFSFYPNYTQNGIVEAMFMVSDDRVADSEMVSITIVDKEFTHHAGIITEDETWSKADNPHLVAGDIDIENGAVVTIEAGCMVHFIEGRRIRVGYAGPGGLMAIGTASDSIHFTSAVDNPTPGIWDGITFAENCVWQTSQLSYCDIAYGGGNGDANVFVEEGTVSITKCIISQSAANGVFFAGDGHAEDFHGNEITNNRGYPAAVSCNYLGRLTGSSLTGNDKDTLIIRGEMVDTDALWDTLGVPFRFTTPFEIAGGATVTIVPGNTLIFDPDIGITIGESSEGTLIAAGTVEYPIVFTASEAPPFAGAWKGLAFYYFSGAECALANCVIEYAGRNQPGSIYANKAVIALQDTKITDGAHYGVYLDGTAHFSVFDGNEIKNNGEYPIRISAKYAGQLTGASSYTPNGIEQLVIYTGELTEEATWLNLGIPYRVTGTVEVDNGGKLTIAAGNTLVFTDVAKVVVGESGPAEFIADGSEGRIVFTGTAEGSLWKGIRFLQNTLSTSLLDSCDINHGGGIGTLANIYLEDCQAIIRHNQIVNGAKGGIYFEGASYPLQFQENTITNNDGFPVTIDCNYIGKLPPENDYAGNKENGFEIKGNTVYTSSTWSDPGVPLIIGSNLTMAPFVQLTLSPGLALQFKAGVGLWVAANSVLIADGTGNQIRFTPTINNQTGEYGSHWQGLVFLPGASDESILKNCFIHKGGIDRVGDPRPGCVHVDACQIRIIDCYVDSSKYNGIYFANGGYPSEFHGNTITLNSYYPVRIDGRYADFLTEDNDYSGNKRGNQIQIGTEPIDQSATWHKIAAPYYIPDGLEIRNDACLTIEAGNTIQTAKDDSIVVIDGGCLIADGQPDDSITFTNISGNWKAIKFDNLGETTSSLNYCVVEYGGKFLSNPKGMIWTINSAPSIANCRISNSLSCGVYMEGSPTPDYFQLMMNNTFIDNRDGCDIGP